MLFKVLRQAGRVEKLLPRSIIDALSMKISQFTVHAKKSNKVGADIK